MYNHKALSRRPTMFLRQLIDPILHDGRRDELFPQTRDILEELLLVPQGDMISAQPFSRRNIKITTAYPRQRLDEATQLND